jgi:3-hydroxyacyl-[acyl-carrier-protein] dehydratase
MPPKNILDPKDIPQATLIDLEGIRKVNAQRFEMEQLTAITLIDPERRIIAGYKDVTDQEFWVRGHMPGFPLMPGVVICEACAQLCSFYCWHCRLITDGFVGFGGLDEVRFRGVVRPGQRLWLLGQTEGHNPRRMTFQMQAFVDGKMVLSGSMLGMPMRSTDKQA